MTVQCIEASTVQDRSMALVSTVLRTKRIFMKVAGKKADSMVREPAGSETLASNYVGNGKTAT